MHSVSLKKTKDITVICHDVTTSRRHLSPCGKKEQNSASAEIAAATRIAAGFALCSSSGSPFQGQGKGVQ